MTDPIVTLREPAEAATPILDNLDHAETLHEDTMRFQYTYAAKDLGHTLAEHRVALRALPLLLDLIDAADRMRELDSEQRLKDYDAKRAALAKGLGE